MGRRGPTTRRCGRLTPGSDPERDGVTRMMDIKTGDDVTEGDQLTLDVRRDCDVEYLRRGEGFMRAKVAADDPFFVYFNHSFMHMPVIPRAEFQGQTGQGDWADSLLELDTDFGTLVDLVDELGIADNTVVVFAGDNGPEDVLSWRRHPRLLGGLVLRRRRREPTHTVHRALAAPRSGRAGERRDHARHRLVHHDPAHRRRQAAHRPCHRRRRPTRLAHRPASVIPAGRLSVLDGGRAVRGQMAELQAGADQTAIHG
jgi:hypothetical protein